MKTIFPKTVYLPVITLIFALSYTAHVDAQPVLTQQSISMGGGGSYLTGPAANFYNPANLMIRDQARRNRIILGQGGFFLSEGIGTKNLMQNYRDFANYFTSYNALETGQSDAETLDRRFPTNSDIFANTARYDVLAFGISFTRNENAYSLALRSRSTNTYEINQSWFDNSFETTEDGDTHVRTLRHNLKTYHELSFGFAREVSMVNGWIPGLSKLYFGIAPKLVIGGMFFDGDYSSTYFNDPVEGTLQHTSQYVARSVARNTNTYVSNPASPPVAKIADQPLVKPQSILKNTGIGMGLDFGLTYIKSLDGDNSLAPGSADPLRKSLRFSISMTDIGFVSYKEQPSVFQIVTDTVNIGSKPQKAERHYAGQIGEFTSFISNYSEVTDSPESSTSVTGQFNRKLPAALHLGSALQYHRFLAAVDLEYQISPVRSDYKGWHTRFGTELRLLKFLPLRAGVSLTPSMKPTLGLGAGIDTGFWELSVATQLKRGINNEIYTVGLAVAALQFRF
ncbi:MAG: DUF5723 family protein [Balneolales bacterium]